MPPIIAHKTLAAIDAAIYTDQGTSYRKALEELLPKMTDAYRPTADRHRSHFGFSSAGESCARKLWYSWLWTQSSKFPARILRLFNRGHLEEARFLAMLISAGYDVHFETADGGQFKIDDHNGHAGSAIDGVVVGIPDLLANTPALIEMKTHNDKQFKQLVKKGVKESHHKHFVQMQIYMKKYKLDVGLYMATNKNDDELHCEIIPFDQGVAERYIERSGMIIYSVDDAPARISNSPGWFECKFCNYNKMCHLKELPEINCRTCTHSSPISNKRWHCSRHNKIISKEIQLKQDCKDHLFRPSLINGAKLLVSDPDDGWIKIAWQNREITLGIKDEVAYTSSQDLINGDYS